MSELIVSVSGIRGVVGETMTPQAALAFAAALATFTEGGKIVIASDGRPSGVMLKHAILSGLLSSGCEIHDLGVTPTPTIGHAVRQLQAAGGIQITASHNPAPWNGLKLFGSSGAVLSAAAGQSVRHIFEGADFRRAAWDRLGAVHACSEAPTWHRERVLALVDVARIQGRHLTAFVDANGGAGGPLARELLGSLGVQAAVQGGAADGRFLHEPEPTEANLAAVCPKVRAAGAAIGLALDPDADRLALIDENGRYIGEELTLALAMIHRLRQQRGPVVVNMSTSRVIEDIAGQFSVPCHRSAVGEANVVSLMQEVGAVIGGEGNGGVIDPRVGWVRDPFIGMALVLNLLADTGKKLSALVAELPVYAIIKDKHPLDPLMLPQLYEALTKLWPEATANCADGLRLDWPDRWVHVRPSNTEPIVRVIAEAPLAADAESLCKAVEKML